MMIVLLFKIKVNKKMKDIDNYIGQYSYPIYLSHFMLAILYSGWIGYGVKEGSFKMELSALLPYGLVLIVFCFLLVYFVDRKVNAYKNKLKQKKLNKQTLS